MTIIIGGGWAGLAAAIELSHHRIPVSLIESAGQLGGRARTIHYRGIDIDNGQHLILGAYHETLRILTIVGVSETDIFERLPLKLRLFQPGYRDTVLSLPALPAPLHVMLGLTLAKGISLQDRWHGIQMCASLAAMDNNKNDDMSVLELLTRKKQSNRMITTLWQPLCLAILNTPVEIASSKIFIKSLRDAFVYKHRDSDLLIARSNLGAILPEPAHRYIEHQGGIVRLQQRVKRLVIDHGKITGVELSKGEFMSANNVILAVPPTNCSELLMPYTAMHDITGMLAEMEYAPICTLYLQYPATTRLPLPMVGLIGSLGQWIFDRRHYGQAGLMAVVISSHGPHMDMDNDALCIKVIDEVARAFPEWPEPVESFVIRERRATFLCRTGINSIRPSTRTPVEGCLLAGDYTATYYPATLEGAVRSGINAARHVIKTNRQ